MIFGSAFSERNCQSLS